MNIVCFNEYDFSIVELNVMADEAKRAKTEEYKKTRQKLFSVFCLSWCHNRNQYWLVRDKLIIKGLFD